MTLRFPRLGAGVHEIQYCGSLRIYQPQAFGSRNCEKQDSTCFFLNHYIHTSSSLLLHCSSLGQAFQRMAIKDPQHNKCLVCLKKSMFNFLSATYLCCTAPVLCNFCIYLLMQLYLSVSLQLQQPQSELPQDQWQYGICSCFS